MSRGKLLGAAAALSRHLRENFPEERIGIVLPASKGAVVTMTRAMAKELGEFGINVNAITPGPVYTEVPRATVTPQQREAMIGAQSIKRAAGTQDLEGTVVFLCSDDSAFITGQTLNVDGGMNLH